MTSNSRRDREVGASFAANADRLHRAMVKRFILPREVIEDACANAWTILLGRPDITLDARGFSWLVAVAINETRRLLGKSRQELPAGGFRSDSSDEASPGEIPEPAADTRDIADAALARVERDDRIAALRELKPLQRQALFLKGMGYSYREIARLSGAACVAAGCRWRA